MENKDGRSFDIPNIYLEKWQENIDTLAKLLDVPAALIMKYEEPYLEVYLSSQTDASNPYHPGDREREDGLYCETVIKDQIKLNIPDALKIPEWENNPDIKLGMINYLGLPVNWPDDTPFGTICVLDRKERQYSHDQHDLLRILADLVESYLQLIYDQNIIADQKQQIDVLHEILPICSYCKKIKKTSTQKWVPLEVYLKEEVSKEASHGICESCYARVSEEIGNLM